MAGESVDICLRVLKESNKSRFDSNSVRNSVLNISHITFRNCCVHIFSDNFSRNSCILRPQDGKLITLIKRMTNNPYVSSVKSRHCMNSLKFQFKSNKRWSVYVITLIPYVNLSLFPTVVLLSGLDIFASTVFHGFTYHQFTRMHFVLSFIGEYLIFISKKAT